MMRPARPVWRCFAVFAWGLALALAGPAAAQDLWPTKGWQTASPESQGMSARELAGLVTFGIDNGMDSVLVTRHGRIVAEAYYAPFTAGQKHRINSATKSVIGSLVAIALKDGTLKSVDQRVLDFFPDRTFANTDDRKKAITLQSLLDMTSGIDWDEPLSNAPPWSMIQMERSSDWVQNILDHGMAAEPGRTFNYNSGNPHLLSAILSKVTGKSAAVYAREKLFGPLGIDDVQWRSDSQGVSTGGFGLSLQPRDMAKLGYLWLHGGAWNGQQILPAEWLDKARHATVPMGMDPLRYGNLFWSLPTQDIFMAVGYDRQLIVVMPGLDIVAVFTGARRYSNANGMPSTPSYRFGEVLGRLKAAVKSDSPLAEDAEASAALLGAVARVAQEVRTPAGQPSSRTAAQISGKVYRLASNELRLQSFTLTFDGDTASYAYEYDGRRYGGPIGFDGFYKVGGQRLFGPGAAKGTWLDDRTFQLEYQTIGNDDAATATVVFDGKSADIRIETLLRLKFDLKGTADD
jgi:CubicO group peptidase (beta-lactamase class C family)